MGKQPEPDSPSSLISVATATGPSHSGMGSASPGLSSVSPSRLLLPPDTVLRAGLEKVAAGAAGSERRDWSPSPPATPEQGLSAFYLSYFDMLYPEDGSWAAKGPGASAREEPSEEPEQCPVIDSQAPGGSLDLAPAGLALEEHSLEQVQSMVVGEVLKDIETACKLLNITADPVDWSPGNVQKWLLWTEHQYRLPPVGKAFQELGGKELCAMSEEQFRQRSPLGGDVLHAHLDIWKSAAWMKERTSPGTVHYCGEPGPQGGAGGQGAGLEGWLPWKQGVPHSPPPSTVAQPRPARTAGPTVRWTHPAPGSPFTCGNSSRSCYSSPRATAASSGGSTRRRVSPAPAGATGRGKGNRQGGGCGRVLLASCWPPPGPRHQAQGRAGGWAEGRSSPHRCPECRTQAPTGLARSLRAFTSASASRPSSVLFRAPGSTQCPGHTKGFKLS
uniref:SAM pointed domain containing ETS transcription factor n=1 Tax=Ailuropoda melanoleuca TaxID=9646 RepID=A0A7N5J8N5_AILME